MTEHHQGRFHALHVQTAPLKRRVLHYSKIKNFLRSPDHKEELLLVFSVTPFKIDQNKNQNRSIDKVQHLGNEKRDIYKDPHQDSGQRNISFYLYGDAMQHGGRKPTDSSGTEFCYRSVDLFFEELINIKVILFLIHELFRWQNVLK